MKRRSRDRRRRRARLWRKMRVRFWSVSEVRARRADGSGLLCAQTLWTRNRTKRHQSQPQDRQQRHRVPSPTRSSSSKASPPKSAPTCSFLSSSSTPALFRVLSLSLVADPSLTSPRRYPGLSSLKLLPTPAGSAPNSGLAFVQYETAAQAGTAREALDEFLLAPETPMKVGWAKRA
jgi:hypothetical protein